MLSRRIHDIHTAGIRIAQELGIVSKRNGVCFSV